MTHELSPWYSGKCVVQATWTPSRMTIFHFGKILEVFENHLGKVSQAKDSSCFKLKSGFLWLQDVPSLFWFLVTTKRIQIFFLEDNSAPIWWLLWVPLSFFFSRLNKPRTICIFFCCFGTYPENLQTSLCVQGKGKEKLQRKKNIKKPHVQLHLPLQLIQTKSFKSIHSDLQR